MSIRIENRSAVETISTAANFSSLLLLSLWRREGMRVFAPITAIPIVLAVWCNPRTYRPQWRTAVLHVRLMIVNLLVTSFLTKGIKETKNCAASD